MAKVAPELQYSDEHEWVAREAGNLVSIGISAVATDALGDVVYVDLPAAGTDVRAGETFGEVESTKSVSDLFSPVSGRVAERNEQLEEAPELVNQDPYGEGWMIVVEGSEPSDLDDLMDADAYRRLVEGEGDT